MEVIDNKALLVNTKYPDRITNSINKSKIIANSSELARVLVNWGFEEAKALKELRFKNVPSPMERDYKWGGQFKPMDHQKTTASFLSITKRGFCFNEQGTGKTASAIWAADYLMSIGKVKKVLVVCPLSIMHSAWQADFFKFAVHRTVNVAYGAREKRKDVINSNAEFIIINYDGVEIVEKDISKAGFDLIIIDEANAYKSVSTKRWKAMKRLATPNVWLWMMTGTPAAQSPVDAFGLGKMCVPDRCPQFFGRFRDMVMLNVGRFKWIPRTTAEDTVFKLLQPAVRFTKSECLDLPPVTHVDREAPLTAQQDKYYRQLKKDMFITAAGEEISSVNAAVNLNKLLQISGGAVYTDTKEVIEFDVSNRLRVVKEVIDEASNKVIVFVPFRHTIQLLQEYLEKNKISNEIINGSVSVGKRTEIFKNFQEATDPHVLIVQPQAASHGVTLTAADTIVWYAPVTSLETYLQANARIDRPGQTSNMTIVNVFGSPVEKRLYSMLQNKLKTHTRLVDLYKKEVENG
jgi:SNF2 family DNA or RNA helicase